MRVAGIHLLQTLRLVDSQRRSAVAVLDGAAHLVSLRLVGDDDAVIAALPHDAAVVAVDAPLAVPGERGQRDVERVLAWCDIPAFPVSGARLTQVHGGARGVALHPRLAAWPRVVEALPDQLLRQLAWEREHPPGSPALALGEYRARWLGLRPPAYRPKGPGRARPAGLAPAHALLAGVLDLRGWTPAPAAGDDWAALADAARLDALASAYLALRLARGGDAETVSVGTPARGEIVLAADASLRARVAVNLERLRGDGAVKI